ncbi:hypothetical protein [Shewanella sp. KT0246]|uniref:hypothetical protein n=1 Tax=Shewanella sp. KT0246 TaxID=2815912 RepID=UPI001BBE34EE|nr:hypothetical protein [Shewanella sp. KT0246]GIU53223.1 hypothetical protein TUM4249_28640 [Shewanella sp. KT0246]
MRLILISMLLLISFGVNANEIKPFTSDGCSVFPDGTFAQNELWLACCTAHDYDYWQGGTFKQRLESDKRLKQCVDAVGERYIANIMLVGVRLGGSPYFPTTYRWGYGWPYPRGYQALTSDEIQQIKALQFNGI